MRFVLAAIGRFGGGNGPERALYDHYAGRISPPPTLHEVDVKKRSLPVPERRRQEAALLIDALPQGAACVALDETGRQLNSIELATRIGTWRDDGIRDIAFLIGGADGLDAGVVKRADLVLSLGRVTWPHLLVRGLIAEQIYRAQCILSGHPYHRA